MTEVGEAGYLARLQAQIQRESVAKNIGFSFGVNIDHQLVKELEFLQVETTEELPLVKELELLQVETTEELPLERSRDYHREDDRVTRKKRPSFELIDVKGKPIERTKAIGEAKENPYLEVAGRAFWWSDQDKVNLIGIGVSGLSAIGLLICLVNLVADKPSP